VNFLNVGPWELTVILIIAILLVGPKRMVEVARSIGRVTGQMRRLSGEFLGTIQTELDATGDEARQAMEGIAESGEESVAELQSTERDARQVLESVDEDRRQMTTSIRDELQAIERETRETMEDILGGVENIVRGEAVESKDAEDAEASEQ